VFATTHWSVVVEAGHVDSPQASEALAQLCHTYWYPLYAYVRRKGYAAHDAQDLTQEFFAKLLARHFLSTADRRKGKFRSFLLGAFEHFLAGEWRRAHAEKRGGGQARFSLEEMNAEERYLLEPALELPPERLFDRRWATTLLETARDELKKEYRTRDQAELFGKLQSALSGDDSVAYAEIGRGLQMSEGAVKVAAHRLRKRYGELIRAQIAQTVATPAQVDEELRYLFAVLRE
jgi:RNA polymerase sigma-70 factor (ECF subfamily)